MDESTAWALVRAARTWWVGGRERVQLTNGPEGGTWLEIEPPDDHDHDHDHDHNRDGDGNRGGNPRWHASAPPSEAAREILDLYLPIVLAPELVIGQLGQSLDGRIATETGHSHYVTGREDILRLHRLRALADAVVVGAGTVAHDNPRLTVREAEGENPFRVVLDPDSRLTPDRHLFSDGAAPTLVVRRAGGPADPEWDATTEAIELPAGPHGFQPDSVLEVLRARGLKRVLVEGGGGHGIPLPRGRCARSPARLRRARPDRLRATCAHPPAGGEPRAGATSSLPTLPTWRGPPLRPRPALSRTSAPGSVDANTRSP